MRTDIITCKAAAQSGSPIEFRGLPPHCAPNDWTPYGDPHTWFEGYEYRISTKLHWSEEFDDNDNSIWEAASPFGDGSDGEQLDPFYFRLKQRLVANRIEWYDASDADIMSKDDEADPRTWATLEEAKAAFQQDDNEIRASIAKEPKP